MSFEVQTGFYGESWENIWSADDKPMVFETVGDALNEIAGEIKEFAALVVSGERTEQFDINNHRIVNNHNNYILHLRHKNGWLAAYDKSGSISIPLSLKLHCGTWPRN